MTTLEIYPDFIDLKDVLNGITRIINKTLDNIIYQMMMMLQGLIQGCS